MQSYAKIWGRKLRRKTLRFFVICVTPIITSGKVKWQVGEIASVQKKMEASNTAQESKNADQRSQCAVSRSTRSSRTQSAAARLSPG